MLYILEDALSLVSNDHEAFKAPPHKSITSAIAPIGFILACSRYASQTQDRHTSFIHSIIDSHLIASDQLAPIYSHSAKFDNALCTQYVAIAVRSHKEVAISYIDNPKLATYCAAIENGSLAICGL